MSEATERERADERFERARAATGAPDPRDYYRGQLRELRSRDERAFRRASDYYENHLVPAVAREGSDPIAEWLEYGRLLAELMVEGRPVQIDPTGRAHPYAPPVPLDHLVLHLPTSAREPALLIGRPPRLTPAQRATYDLLVKQALGE